MTTNNKCPSCLAGFSKEDIAGNCTCEPDMSKNLEQQMQELREKFVEAGAALEHARWARWHKFMRDKWTHANVKRWNKQADTLYTDLSETEKESDRREVREYIPLLKEFAAEIRASTLEEVKEAVDTVVKSLVLDEQPKEWGAALSQWEVYNDGVRDAEIAVREALRHLRS